MEHIFRLVLKLKHSKSMPTLETKDLFSSSHPTQVSHPHTLNQTLITDMKKRDINPSRRYVLISTVIPSTSEEAVKRKDGKTEGRDGEKEGRKREKEKQIHINMIQ